MSGTRTFADVTDDGLLFSNIQMTETSSGTVTSLLNDPDNLVTPLPTVGDAGLRWSGFVGSVRGPGSLTVTISYDVAQLDPQQMLTGILRHTFSPDVRQQTGAVATVTQQVFSLTGVQLATSTLTYRPGTADTVDPAAEVGDSLTFAAGQQSVRVVLTVSLTVAAGSPTTTTASFSGLSQAYAEAPAASLGNLVWEDANRNGIQDDGELGLSGVTVRLLDATGTTVLATTTTNADGLYAFNSLAPATYRVQVTGLEGYAFSPADTDGNDALDSDAGANGLTGPYTLVGGQANMTADAGLFRAAPGISVVKLTNGVDGPVLLAGSAVTWTYAVSNTGNVALAGVALRDDDGTPGDPSDDFAPVFAGGDTDNDGLLDTGETWQFTASGAAGAADYANLATVTGGYTDSTGRTVEVSDTDPSGYTVATPGISVVKLTNGVDGPVLLAGSAVTWTYAVSNTGNVALAGVALRDDDGTPGDPSDDFAPVFAGGDTNNDGLLDTGETWQFTASGVAGAADYANLATVTGGYTDSTGRTVEVSDTDPSGYTVARPTVDIEKLVSVNGGGSFADADTGPGPSLLQGGAPVFRFVVTNTGNVTLTDLVVSDDRLDLNGAAAGTTVTIASLGAGESRSFDVTGPWQQGQHTNTATVTGSYTDSAGNTAAPTDSDAANYVGIPTFVTPPRTAIDIEKTTNGPGNANAVAANWDNEDTATGTGVPILAPGGTVTWTYRVTNTGERAFTAAEIALVDDNGTQANTADDMSIANGRVTFLRVDSGDSDSLLEAGESWLYQATGTVQNLATLGAATTFDFSGSTATDGADGNVRSYTAGGISVKASGFARDKASGTWSTAWLGSFSGGLGVTDASEGTGSGATHTVDNIGRDNYALFHFDRAVVVDSAFLGWVVGDSDLRVWIGNNATPFSSTMALSDAFLGGLGFTELNTTTSTAARMADFNAGNVAGNVLVIAAATGEASPNDQFKIDTLKVQAVTGSGVYSNLATVTAGGATDSDLSHYRNPAAPAPVNPRVDIEKLVSVDGGATFLDADTATGPTLAHGATPIFRFVVTNTGDVALANVSVTDDKLDLNGASAGTARSLGSLAAGGSITFDVAGSWQSGQHTNLATVTGSYTSPLGTATTVTDSDAANFTGAAAPAAPGTRTPGFWSNWGDFWDGDASAPRQAGTPGFASGDILVRTYGDAGPCDPVTGLRRDGILIGDFNKNGITDAGERTIFYTVPEAVAIINASNNTMGADARYILDRQLVATWLNYLAGNPLTDAANSASVFDARDAVTHAINWLIRETPDENGNGLGDGSLTLNASTFRVAPSSADWNSMVGGIPAGNTIKNWLDEYNNNGTVNGVRIASDGDWFN